MMCFDRSWPCIVFTHSPIFLPAEHVHLCTLGTPRSAATILEVNLAVDSRLQPPMDGSTLVMGRLLRLLRPTSNIRSGVEFGTTTKTKTSSDLLPLRDLHLDRWKVRTEGLSLRKTAEGYCVSRRKRHLDCLVIETQMHSLTYLEVIAFLRRT